MPESGLEGLEVVRHRLTFTSPKVIVSNPLLIMKAFEESARLKIPLGGEAKRLIREFGHLADETFSASEAAVRSFEKILRTPAPTFNVLNEMLKTGFLARFIPEFKDIADRIQYDEYHLYPVDRHSLKAVRILKTFGTKEDLSGDPLSGELYKGLSRRTLLLWATLLHDIGKGDPEKNHSGRGADIAGNILHKKGYKPAAVETVVFLVKHHLLLVKTATRRDVNDEETAIFCARIIRDAKRLKMLYLLSVADSMATGPKAWTSWTASLMRDLFFKVLNVIEKGELASVEAVRAIETKKMRVLERVVPASQRRSFESLLAVMSPRYLLYAPTDDMYGHIQLYQQLGDAPFVWKVKLEPESDIREVTICAKDRPGLVSKIAGVFTLNKIDILDTQVFTWRNHIALDIFKVKAPLDRIFESERWEQTAKDLADAIDGKLDLTEALKKKLSRIRSIHPPAFGKPNRVVVDQESSSFFTIIEVFAYDYPGLLFSITDALLQCRLDVWVAKIATYLDQVVDVFYVRDFDGQKVDSPEQAAAIAKTVEAVLPGSSKNVR
jgi:[protein-PII] uridylyltransferase